MGSGFSQKKKTDNAVAKIGVINAFKSASKASSENKTGGGAGAFGKSRSNVYDFVKAQRQQKEEDWEALQNQDSGHKAGLEDEEIEGAELYDYSQEDYVENMCPLCGKVPMCGVDGHPCRVCGHVYHRACLTSSPHYSAQEAAWMDRALTTVGWSCHQCDNICNLLSSDEQNDISNKFDDFDVNRDATVSESEFLQFRERENQELMGRPLSPDSVEFEKQQFRRLDADNSGELDYWEFMKHEASKKLARKDKLSLVRLLTPKERYSMRKYYEALDINGDGVVMETEARIAYRSWYGNLSKVVDQNTPGAGKGKLQSQDVDRHIDRRTGLIMGTQEGHNRIITWPAFVREQALYVISSRPNKVNLAEI